MDTLIHGLWTYVASPSKRSTPLLRWQLFFGVFPDLVWLPVTAYWLLTTGHLNFSMAFYEVSHSFVVWGAVVLVAMVWYRKAYLALWPWALHILIDIPGHNAAKDLLTPFLWPVSDVVIRGWWNWLSVPWLIANYAAVAVVIAVIVYRGRNRSIQ